jgi:LemA protein
LIQQVPTTVWAGMAGYHAKTEYYSADAGSKTAPKVDFTK